MMPTNIAAVSDIVPFHLRVESELSLYLILKFSNSDFFVASLHAAAIFWYDNQKISDIVALNWGLYIVPINDV